MDPAQTPPPIPAGGPFPLPWPDAATVQWIRDGEHLKTLSVCHYVVGGLAILFSSLFIFYVVFGVMMLSNPKLFEPPSASVALPSPTASPNGAADPADAALAPRRSHRPRTYGDSPPAFVGYVFAGMGAVAILLGWTTGALLIYSGRCLARRQRRVFSMVMAGISCLQVPFGTVLGVFTLVILQRPSVKALYTPTPQG